MDLTPPTTEQSCDTEAKLFDPVLTEVASPQDALSDLALLIYRVFVCAHFAHLQTKDANRHEALAKLYKKGPKLFDRMLETAYGSAPYVFNSTSYLMFPRDCNTEIDLLIQDVRDRIADFLETEGADITILSVFSILVDIHELLATTSYRLGMK